MNTSFVNNNHSNSHNFNTNITSIGSSSSSRSMTPTVNSSTPGSEFHTPPVEFPTNPITKYFSIERQVASCGPELIWKVYDAIRRQDKKPCSVFIFEKSIADKLHKPRRRDIVTSVLKRDVRLLSQLHHPNLLHIIHPIEETSETLSFASERVYASLANILGNYTRLQPATIQNLKTFRFTDMDRKLGIYQLTQILRFLHTGQSLFHNNVSPCSILITHRNQWRLGSAAFLESTRLETADKCQYELGPSPWTRKWPKMARPDCHFSAPECFTLTTSMLNPFSGLRNKTSTDYLHHSVNKNSIINNNNNTSNSPDHMATSKSMKAHQTTTTPHQNDDFPGPWSDMFSLGLIICSLYNIGSPAEGSVQWSQNIKKLGVENDAYASVEAILNCKENIAQENSAEFIHAIQLSQSSDIPEAFRSSVCRMPLELVEPVEKLLSRNTQKRPSSQLFALLKFFNDPTMLLLDGMTNFDVKSDDDRTRALQILQNNAENLSKPILYGRIFPMLVDLHWQLERRQCTKQGNNETVMHKSTAGQQSTDRSSPNDEACHMFDSLIIAGLAHLVEICSSGDYTDFIEKDLISIFQKATNLKTKICLVRYTRSFLRQVPDSIIEQYILPLVKQCLVSNNVLAQIMAFNNLELLIGYISLSDLEIIVLQKIKQAFQQPNQKLQLAALHCLVSVITHLSDQIITNDVIPFLLNVSKELQTPGKPKLNGDHRSREYVNKNEEYGLSEYADDGNDDNDVQLMSSCAKRRNHPSYNGGQEQQGDEGEEQPIAELCNAWKKLLYTKSHLLEPQLIAKDIFPGLLPHVVDKQVNITGFRILMSTLYALLDLLDIPNNESEDQTDSTTQYRTVPAVTVNAPGINSGQSSKRSSQCEPMEKPKMGPRKSIARAAVPFVPMLHPNQLKELENSPNITRRASAHVICPLPPQNNDPRFDKPMNDSHYQHHHHLPDKDNSASLSFLGLQLPTVSKLRRHSCDAQQKEKMTASSNMLCETPKDSLSRRSSDHSLQDKDTTSWYTSQKSRSLLNSEEKSLLTAQVCEGPFVRTPSLQPKPSWHLEPVSEPDKSSLTASNNKLGRELNIKHNASRRSSFTAIGDTVMNLLTK
uniref:Protein kinase domain-containing protein n=1 Tax=Trichobilharzia regenti TaxID=157069 RepID=A0AA85IYC4_TRIRE|nr:unnamed protein product [Trichobilharzia regenti]